MASLPGYADLIRLKPTVKSIDIQALIESGIDCEFTDHKGGKYISRLTSVKGGYYWSDQKLYGMGGEAECIPRMNYWHSLSNFDAASVPLPPGFDLKVRALTGTEIFCVNSTSEDREPCWHGSPIASPVIDFMITGISDGYTLNQAGEANKC